MLVRRLLRRRRTTKIWGREECAAYADRQQHTTRVSYVGMLLWKNAFSTLVGTYINRGRETPACMQKMLLLLSCNVGRSNQSRESGTAFGGSASLSVRQPQPSTYAYVCVERKSRVCVGVCTTSEEISSRLRRKEDAFVRTWEGVP